ncbi:probable 4-coumarate--CoA ligase 2 [Scaptodrosophila lebanonensis]|uniref:Probable 4-coumarate--CoA ligase 2 n=1 Tax=Drosophila lebanonensis TaxID=7225 RepID=A0A6J2TGA0_DROLE|nr:probable 4-coumarate--CoA ligase 2 [Scaptodrosophila lebanonensis]
MLDLNGNPTTSYDAVQQMWSGSDEQSLYNNELTIGQIIFKQLQREPQRLFQISHTEKTRLSRTQMLHDAAKVCSYLRLQGLNASSIVGLIGRNTTHLAAVAYGCMFNGTPFHAVNPNTEAHTIQSLYSITKPRIICCDGQDYVRLKDIAVALKAQIVTLSGHIAGVTSVEQLLQTPLSENFEPTRLERGSESIMAILCSSGTTGTPKAVTLSNSRLIFEQHSYLTANDVQYAPSTLDWLTGLITLITAGVYGTQRVISTEPFSCAHFLELCEQYSISWAIVAASYIAMLANYGGTNGRPLRSLRHLLFAGGHTLVTTLQKMQTHLQGQGVLRNAYGLTELGSIASCNYTTHSKPNSVGRLCGGICMRIVSDAGKFLGPKEVGELYCRNGQLWAGYYGNEKATAEMQDKQGWFHTGDVGYFDEDNYLYIVERKKDMLKYMNMMYYPHEIEEVIAQMPDVSEVCVFGLWNEIEGDAAAASVVRKKGSSLRSSDVEQFVRQHVTVKYKQLNGGTLMVDQLAKSANGKVNRQAVKKHYLEATKTK